MIFLVLSGKIIFVFPENMIFSFRHKRKIIRKIPGNMIFHSNVLKRWFFQKNSCLNMIFFVIPGKMVFLFFEKICYFFFRQKMKEEDDLYQKIHGNIIFSVFMRRCYKYDMTLLAKNQRCPCPEKMHLTVTSPASLKKMIFILENIVFLLKYHID